MKIDLTRSPHVSFPRTFIAVAAGAFLLGACSSMELSGSGSSGTGMPGGGVSLPGGGGSSGGGADGSSGGGMPPGGGSSGGSGGSTGGTSGGSTGGSSGGGGDTGPVDSVEIPGGGAGGQDCNDGGMIGGGIGGGMGCDPSSAGEVGQFPAGGDPEKAEQLGKELEESVGDFDEVLMEEQREIETVGRDTEGYGSGSSGGSGGRVSLGEQAAGAMGGASDGGAGGGGGAAGGSNPLEGMDDSEIARRTPDDIEVIMDDDIVARQLREAALAEDDPELRERLWEEYRKYKGM